MWLRPYSCVAESCQQTSRKQNTHLIQTFNPLRGVMVGANGLVVTQWLDDGREAILQECPFHSS